MHPPTASAFWQGFAGVDFGADFGFAMGAVVGQADGHAGCFSYGPRLCLDCTPSLAVRPAPQLGRPDLFFKGYGGADARASADHTKPGSFGRGFPFIASVNTVNSCAITTLRGTEPCVSISSFLHLPPRPLRAAWRPRPSAALAARSQVPPSQMLWMKTWLPVPRLARWQGLRPAVCRGCRPAVATDLTAASGQPDATSQRPSGQIARVAFVISASRRGRGARGERCSRRS